MLTYRNNKTTLFYTLLVVRITRATASFLHYSEVTCANDTILAGCRVCSGTAHHMCETGFASTVICFLLAFRPLRSAIGSLRSPYACQGLLAQLVQLITSLTPWLNCSCCNVHVRAYFDSRCTRVLRVCSHGRVVEIEISQRSFLFKMWGVFIAWGEKEIQALRANVWRCVKTHSH